mgnify:CR=1 FL=1
MSKAAYIFHYQKLKFLRAMLIIFDTLYGYLTFEVIQELSRDVMDSLLFFRDDVFIKEREAIHMTIILSIKSAG